MLMLPFDASLQKASNAFKPHSCVEHAMYIYILGGSSSWWCTVKGTHCFMWLTPENPWLSWLKCQHSNLEESWFKSLPSLFFLLTVTLPITETKHQKQINFEASLGFNSSKASNLRPSSRENVQGNVPLHPEPRWHSRTPHMTIVRAVPTSVTLVHSTVMVYQATSR